MNETPWRGELADGQSAALHEVRLAVVGSELAGRRAADGEELLRWPLGAIKSEALDERRVLLTCPAVAPGVELTVSAELVATHLVVPGGLAPKPSRFKRVLAYGLGTVAAAALIYVNLDPLSRAIARRVPRHYEAELGRGLEQFFKRQYCETPEDRVVLARLADRLGGGASELHVLDTEMVNAFTFPGGVVMVTRGLLREAHGPDELAGVLAHELEHVEQRHVMTHFVRSSMMTALWQATMGDFTGLFVLDPKTAVDIASLKFSRADEAEADQGAVARLGKGGVSRDGFRAFFERLKEQTDVVPAWLSNHPASADRITAIGHDPGALPKTPALSADDWKVLKHACGQKDEAKDE